MAEKKIVSIGFDWPGNKVRNYSIKSRQSLLDGDIIVFIPDIYAIVMDVGVSFDSKEIKKVIYDEDKRSFVLDTIRHWKDEIKYVLSRGKTVFIFLVGVQEIRMYNSFDKRVKSYSNYDLLPFDIKVTTKTVKEIKSNNEFKLIHNYWDQFGSISEGRLIIDDYRITPLLTTKGAEKIVGGIYSSNGGMLVFLPPLNATSKSIYNYETDSLIKDPPTLEEFGERLFSSFIEIDKLLRIDSSITPPPDWTVLKAYKLSKVQKVEEEIGKVRSDIEKLEEDLAHLMREKEVENQIKALLYETGKPLESSIIEALKVLGFEAESYMDESSQFDSIFISPEGRFLGEAEGKENKAINIEKLDQLIRNILEDNKKDTVQEPAKGVLFGNAFRLKPLEEREEFFTDKCIGTARLSRIALVKTPDLFFVARYLKESGDPEFARKCREAIRRAEGVVVEFPPVPRQS